LSVNHEWGADGSQTSNLEGVASAEHAVFGYDFPKIDYSAELTAYPSLTDWGRVRLEFDLHFRRAGVVDRVVDHLGGPVVPDVAHVVGQIGHVGRHHIAPHEVFLQPRAGKSLPDRGQKFQTVNAGTGRALGFDESVPHQSLQVAACDLSGDAESSREAGTDSVSVGGDQVESSLASRGFVIDHEPVS
ncbi:MAG: hypothetical protein ACKOCT_03050, partial [Alphaproteobacteria bacterium]